MKELEIVNLAYRAHIRSFGPEPSILVRISEEEIKTRLVPNVFNLTQFPSEDAWEHTPEAYVITFRKFFGSPDDDRFSPGQVEGTTYEIRCLAWNSFIMELGSNFFHSTPTEHFWYGRSSRFMTAEEILSTFYSANQDSNDVVERSELELLSWLEFKMKSGRKVLHLWRRTITNELFIEESETSSAFAVGQIENARKIKSVSEFLLEVIETKNLSLRFSQVHVAARSSDEQKLVKTLYDHKNSRVVLDYANGFGDEKYLMATPRFQTLGEAFEQINYPSLEAIDEGRAGVWRENRNMRKLVSEVFGKF